jgi:large repetitive protein
LISHFRSWTRQHKLPSKAALWRGSIQEDSLKLLLRVFLLAVLGLGLSAASFAQGKASQQFTLVVNAGTVSITTTSVPMAVTTVAYSATLTASGGIAPYTFSVSSGSLPAGLSLSAAGAISGTPTTTGTSSFTIKVADSESPAVTATQSFTQTTIAPLTITATTLPAANGGVPYSGTVAFTGGFGPFTCSITAGTLPTGLTLGPATSSGCPISGTPTQDGSFTITVQVTDSATVPE